MRPEWAESLIALYHCRNNYCALKNSRLLSDFQWAYSDCGKISFFPIILGYEFAAISYFPVLRKIRFPTFRKKNDDHENQ